ncbi:MAG TPA: hydrogenase maturation protease [Thermoanaerobaculia bacterium]|jgi:hydrogenase maturation protease|nr:hydrogenase maturation protease [Thermoanaerobaculia bacterium]
MSQRQLVAGIGNIFMGDDGFGVEVVRQLAGRPLPPDVRVADYGTRGIHLAFELLDHPDDLTVLVDATPRGGEPGTVYLVEPDVAALGAGAAGWADAHAMTPDAVFGLLRTLGGTPRRVLLVGCEPLRCDEELGLSPPVAAAVEQAVNLILDVLRREGGVSPETSAPSRAPRRRP